MQCDPNLKALRLRMSPYACVIRVNQALAEVRKDTGILLTVHHQMTCIAVYYICHCSCLSSEDGRTRRRNSLSSLPLNDSEAERPRSPFPIPSPVPLGHGRSQSSSSLHERDRGLPNGELVIECKKYHQFYRCFYCINWRIWSYNLGHNFRDTRKYIELAKLVVTSFKRRKT